MGYKKLAEQIISLSGGAQNIEKNLISATKLRLELKNPENADIEKIKKLGRVSGVQMLSGNRINITLGYGFVNLIGEELSSITKLELEEFRDTETDEKAARENNGRAENGQKSLAEAKYESRKAEDLEIEKTVQSMIEKKIKKNMELKKRNPDSRNSEKISTEKVYREVPDIEEKIDIELKENKREIEERKKEIREQKIKEKSLKKEKKKLKKERIRLEKSRIGDISELYMPTIAENHETAGNFNEEILKAEEKASVQSNFESGENSKKKEKLKIRPEYRFPKLMLRVFIPILPALVLGGLIQGITETVNILTRNMYTNIWWYQIICTVGWGIFAYLPVFVLMNVVKELKGTAILGAAAGVLFVSNFKMPLLMEENAVLFPITDKPYFYSFGGIATIFFLGFLIAAAEKILKKTVPFSLTTFLTPVLTVILSAVAGVFVVQVIGGNVLPEITRWMEQIYNLKGVSRSLLSFFELPVSLLGMDEAYGEISKSSDSIGGITNGINHLLPLLMMSSISQSGAALAIFFRTESRKLKNIIRDTVFAGILGIGEPLLFTVSLPLFKPFVISCIGSGIGGIVLSFFNIGAVTKGASGIFGFLIIDQSAQMLFTLSMFLAFSSSFLLTFFTGVNEEKIEKIYGK